MERVARSAHEMRALAAEFAAELHAGDAVALTGPLGSGKTTFVAGVASALAPGAETSSPTFTFWQRYAGNPPIDHLDLFRITGAADLRELGLEAAFGGDSIVLVEWAERAAELLPERRYEIRFAGCGDEPRQVRIQRPP